MTKAMIKKNVSLKKNSIIREINVFLYANKRNKNK